MTAQQLITALQKEANPNKAKILQGFFKTGKGQYGEGDRFIGLTVPVIRRIVNQHRALSRDAVPALLKSPIHEVRMAGLLLLVEQCKKAAPAEQQAIVDLYLAHTATINNWDLVDLSAPTIIGEFLLTRPRDLLYTLVASPSLWEQRIAIVATLTLIRKNEFADTLVLAERLLSHPHDLIHKAVGWMLREVGKRDEALLKKFLLAHYAALPRTALRYAIERFPEAERKRFLTLDKPKPDACKPEKRR